jgi:polyhydroxyalkanoate synthesis regulator phasin
MKNIPENIPRQLQLYFKELSHGQKEIVDYLLGRIKDLSNEVHQLKIKQGHLDDRTRDSIKY